jgi:hypothetical protein
MSTDLKQQLSEELSTLVREYESRGLSPDAIADELSWHHELADTRSCEDSDRVVADD